MHERKKVCDRDFDYSAVTNENTMPKMGLIGVLNVNFIVKPMRIRFGESPIMDRQRSVNFTPYNIDQGDPDFVYK